MLLNYIWMYEFHFPLKTKFKLRNYLNKILNLQQILELHSLLDHWLLFFDFPL